MNLRDGPVGEKGWIVRIMRTNEKSEWTDHKAPELRMSANFVTRLLCEAMRDFESLRSAFSLAVRRRQRRLVAAGNFSLDAEHGPDAEINDRRERTHGFPDVHF